MQQLLKSVTLSNGLVVVAETLPDAESAAFCWLLPAGSIHDAPGRHGSTSLLADLMFRGAGDRNGRQLVTALTRLGVQNEESATPAHLVSAGVCVGANFPDVLPLYADVLQRAHLPEEELDPARAGLEQSLLSIEDDPRLNLLQELRRRAYRAPWGLPPEGELDELPAITIDEIQSRYRAGIHPGGAILGIAGAVDLDVIVPILERTLGGWKAKPEAKIESGPRGPTSDHIVQEAQQTQIGIAIPAPPYREDDYIPGWAAVNILSGGMSSRLFTEVREKRGLCYSVYATMHSLKDEARVLGYAGTQNDRAQETLDVMVGEFRRLKDGIAEEELDRCKAIAKSSLVMAQESTQSRAGSIARDWYHLGKIRTLQELRARIDALTVPQILDYLERWPLDRMTVVTLGPEPLEIPT